MRVTPGIVALLLCAAAPARAADLSTLACVADGISDAVRTDIADSVRDLAAGGKAPPPEASRQALTEAAERCGTRFGWSDAARGAARTYTLVHLGRAALDPIAEDAGIKAAPFAEVMHGLTPDQRAKILQQDQAAIDSLIAVAKEHGIPLDSYNQNHLLGILAALVIFEEDQKAAFLKA